VDRVSDRLIAGSVFAHSHPPRGGPVRPRPRSRQWPRRSRPRSTPPPRGPHVEVRHLVGVSGGLVDEPGQRGGELTGRSRLAGGQSGGSRVRRPPEALRTASAMSCIHRLLLRVWVTGSAWSSALPLGVASGLAGAACRVRGHLGCRRTAPGPAGRDGCQPVPRTPPSASEMRCRAARQLVPGCARRLAAVQVSRRIRRRW
jgi:hypothetical protein